MESTMYTVGGKSFELRHYGVKGMKWGRRKAREEYAKLDRLRREYRRAGRMYRRADKEAHQVGIGDIRSANRRKLRDIKAQQYRDAKTAYKEQKKNVRANTTISQKSARAITSALKIVGPLYYTDLALTGGVTTRAAIKVGKTAVKSALNNIGDQMFDYSLLDKSGKIIKRFN